MPKTRTGKNTCIESVSEAMIYFHKSVFPMAVD